MQGHGALFCFKERPRIESCPCTYLLGACPRVRFLTWKTGQGMTPGRVPWEWMGLARKRAPDSVGFQSVNGCFLLLGRVPSCKMFKGPSLRRLCPSPPALSRPARRWNGCAGSTRDRLIPLGLHISAPVPPPTRIQQGAGHQKTSQGSKSAPVTVRSPHPGPSGPQGSQSPEEAAGARLAWEGASGCVWTPPPEAVRLEERAPGGEPA